MAPETVNRAIRWVIDHIDNLRVLLADNPIDISALNETWLDTSIRDNDVFISGYEIVRRDRYVRGVDGKMYGGVFFLCSLKHKFLITH